MKKLLKYTMSFGLSVFLSYGLHAQGINQKLGPAYAPTIDSLFYHSGTQNQPVFVEGRFSKNDGLAAWYIYDSTSTATEIPYQVFPVIGKSTGRWILIQLLSAGGGDSTIYTNEDYLVINILTIPPVSPTTGDKYLAGVGSAGAWIGQDNDIETWSGSAWTPTVPTSGQLLINGANDDMYKYSGAIWTDISSSLPIHKGGDKYGNAPLNIGNNKNFDFNFMTHHIVRGGFSKDGYFSLYYRRNGSSSDSVTVIENGELKFVSRADYLAGYLTSYTETDPLSVHISDSAAMLLPYLRKNVAAATYVPYTVANIPAGFPDSMMTIKNGTVGKVPYSDIVPSLDHVTSVGNISSRPVYIQSNNNANTVVTGLALQNSTAATSLVTQQFAPALELMGNYWDAGSGLNFKRNMRMIYQPGDAIHSYMAFQDSVSGFGWTNMFSYEGGTGITSNGFVSTGNIIVGNTLYTNNIANNELWIGTAYPDYSGGPSYQWIARVGNNNGVTMHPNGIWHTLEIRQQYGDNVTGDSTNNVDLYVSPSFKLGYSGVVHYLADIGTENTLQHFQKFTIDTSGNTHIHGNLTVDGTYPGSGGSSTFAGLTDVLLTSLATNDLLYYNGSHWINATPAGIRSILGLVIGTNVQAYDADLTTYAGITPSANVQTLLGSADFSAFRTSLSLNNVENTALSTWPGTTNITTLGTIGTGTWQGTAIADAYISSSATWNAKQTPLTRTSVKTSAYTAAVNDLVPVNTTSSNVTITLPTAPADKARITVKHIIQGGTNTVTVATGGSDVFNKTGGSTTLTLSLLAQGVELQYDAANAIWTVLSDDLPLSQLDLRYVLATDATYVKTVVLNTPSVIYSTPITFTTSGNTATGTLTLNSQTANTFFAAPNGSNSTPTFRAIVAADIPTLNQNTSGTAANLSGTPTLPNGTAATTQATSDNSTKLATTAYVKSWIPTHATLGSNQTTTSTTMAATPTFSLAVVAGVEYHLEIDIKTACDNTGGVKLGLSITGSPTLNAGSIFGQNASTTGLRYGEITAVDGTTNVGNFNTVAANAEETLLCGFTAGTTGTIQLYFGSVTSTQTSTIRAGTEMFLTPVQ
jgi:hypothetical protein